MEPMRKLVFASANPGKIREANEILEGKFLVIPAAEAGVTEEIPETGATIEENSVQKAVYLYEHTGLDCFADDTGLEVEALGGAPGVHTARYGNPSGKDFNANIDRLLREMQGVENRRARFRTCVTLLLGGEMHRFEGIMEGQIATERRGTDGFGYDPVFLPDGCGGLSAAELTHEAKNAISHRGKALRALAAYLLGRSRP